ncbi:unknown [Cercopithecine alphaherpesvirus 9]|uniref:Nuclear protein UL55 n=1 Tax=Cercopithecine herpesvirus 9 (strain DHV) TaxID=36348 RepID=Q9E213_CHV9D|nr:nuclear protein UL55 [Cercopithecine alphaherpesvirus 9]AAG27203.1 unknown [Cercopithecine alphaherpesvirus 9]
MACNQSVNKETLMIDLKPDALAPFTQAVAPLALETTWISATSSHAPTPSPLYGTKRLCALRATCTKPGDVHAYLIGLSHKDKPSEFPLFVDIQNLCKILQCQRLLKEMANYSALCDAPFSAATLQIMLDSGSLGVHLSGVGYHCHCKTPFSVDCWAGAAEAYDHIVCTLRVRNVMGISPENRD